MPWNGASPKVLVVEDDEVINQAVTSRLQGSGYDVVQAWDGPGAVTQFTDVAPDLVVLDVMLPGYDGHEVCRRIQAQRPVPLMLTARDDEADVLVGLGVRVDWAYLQGLSAEAVPVLANLPDEVVGCALMAHEPGDDDWLEWNLGRQRAEPLLRSHRIDGESDVAVCSGETG
jgi:CheY-like chemotaxis protein